MRTGVFLLAAQFPGQGHAEALDRAVSAAVGAEEAGLDSVWLAEHHFVPYGVCPSAATLAALLLGRTQRIRVGTAVSVLPTQHPVSLGEQASLLHLTSGGRFTLGVGRGGPWVDLDVFGTGLEAYESGFAESLELLLRWLRSSRVSADGPRYRFPEVAVVPRASEQPLPFPAPGGFRGPEYAGAHAPDGRRVDGPPVMVACTSLATVRLAAQQGVPMLLGMHSGDEDKAAMVAAYRTAAREAGHNPDRIARIEAEHMAAGVAQVEDSGPEAQRVLLKSMPGWFNYGLSAHRTVDGRERRMRDPREYTELLCELHAVGTPRLCADRLAATAERTGVRRFALLVEGSGDREATLRNVERLGSEVLPLLV
ncbi:LLM class flavin-dependent oxidoreductase [Streptacidiphilus sp. P02-A3a]|uniref:LLM class flavin-dependent oxidoreductase n=1 Tax=Streptacidiphilus sp. P02-A3a TaxID=2704468 RepID=UPI0015FA44F2|nr:LLM class flavin-dependent oxidoreductase [Streptacidiphilus sp. P02-A3a]QMU74228.1 LLM class flavin-dependent oxidoreductase [Streptacidiphilus sp. P02-A3a]